MQLAVQAVREATKALPPVTVAAAALAGLSLQMWVYIAALVYTGCQIAYLGWKWIREWRASCAALPKPPVPPGA